MVEFINYKHYFYQFDYIVINKHEKKINKILV